MGDLRKVGDTKEYEDVTWEDQQKINRFSTLNNRQDEIRARLKDKREILANADDAQSELIIAEDDEDTVYFRIGESFVKISKDEADERLGELASKTTAEIEKLNHELSVIDTESTGLKVALKAKFGSSINLEA